MSVNSDTVAAPEPNVFEIDPMVLEQALDRLRAEQSLVPAVVAGTAAAVFGAALWGVITVVTEYQIGWMAIGVGALVGIAVRLAGKGVDRVFSVVAAALALFGCALGNLLAGCGFVAAQESVPVTAVLTSLNAELISIIMSAMFSPMDLFFYGFAVYQAYRLSLRPVTEDDIVALTGAVVR